MFLIPAIAILGRFSLCRKTKSLHLNIGDPSVLTNYYLSSMFVAEINPAFVAGINHLMINSQVYKIHRVKVIVKYKILLFGCFIM